MSNQKETQQPPEKPHATRNTIKWLISPRQQKSEIISDDFTISNTHDWSLRLQIIAANKTIQFFLGNNQVLDGIPDVLLHAAFDLYYGDEHFHVEPKPTEMKLNKSKEFIAFKPLNVSIEKLTNNFLETFSVHFTYGDPAGSSKCLGASNYLDGLSFSWKHIDCSQKPMMKTSPIFPIKDARGTRHNAQCYLSNNNDRVQICIKTIGSKICQIEGLIKNVSVELMCKNEEKPIVYENHPFHYDPEGEMIYFKTMPTAFSKLTNNYRNTFDVVVYINETPVSSRSSTNSLSKAVSNCSIQSPVELEKVNLAVFPPNPQTLPVLRNLNHMLVKQEMCDVTFDCQGTRVSAHRNILCCRSEYFRNLLKANNKIYYMHNIQSDVLVDVLQFAYTGCAPHLKNTCERMIVVADGFGMPDLRQSAENTLLERFKTIHTHEQMDRIFDLYHNDKLRAIVLDFIDGNLDRLMEDPIFEAVLKKRPDVFYDLFKAILR